MPQLSDDDLNKLIDFYGYGSLGANVWFVGMEEGGGGEENLLRRLQFNQVEDCREAMKKLEIYDWHWGSQKIQSTWRGMCCIMLALANVPISRDTIRNYQVEKLGRADGKTLLAELMPLPKPNLKSWNYCNVLPQFKDSHQYYSTVMPKRIKMFQHLLSQYFPTNIICYGKRYWPQFKEIFPLLEFRTMDNGLFHFAQNGKSNIFLTDHFTARSMNDGLSIIIKSVCELSLNK